MTTIRVTIAALVALFAAVGCAGPRDARAPGEDGRITALPTAAAGDTGAVPHEAAGYPPATNAAPTPDRRRAHVPLAGRADGQAGVDAGAATVPPSLSGVAPGPGTVEPGVAAATSGAAGVSGSCPGIARRDGSRLVIDGEPFFLFGLNATFMLDSTFPEPEVERLLAALSERGVNTLRVWYFAEHDPERLARLLDAGRRHGIRFVVTLGDNVFKGRDWFFSDEDEDVYRPHLERTVARFRDRPEILLWEVMNEPNCGEGRYDDDCLDAIREWITLAAGMIKAIDPCHAVSTGMIGAGNYENEETHYRKVHGKGVVDVVSVHRRSTEDIDTEFEVAADMERPLLYGEVYDKAYTDGCGPLEGNDSPRERAERIKDDIEDAVERGVAGYLLWDLAAGRIRMTDGGERDYCSSFGYPLDDPLWRELSSAGLPPDVPW